MSLKMPTVSIIVSAYRGIKYLPATLNSILQQTYPYFEVLVFSNNYAQTISWFRQHQDARFRFFFPDNLGIAQTLNQGIFQARGNYISWIDAGDQWHPTKLQKQLFCLEQFPEIGFVSSWLMLKNGQNQSTATIVKPEYSAAMNLQIRQVNQSCSKSLMVRRCCLEEIGFFDQKLKAIPGWDLWIRLNRRYQLMQIAETLVYGVRNQGQFCKNYLILETDLQTIIDKAFPHNLGNFTLAQGRSYGSASLFLARTVLADQESDPAIAHNYCQQALAHDPAIGISGDFIRLKLAIMTASCLKSDRYLHLSSLVKNIALNLRETSQRLVDWMLEEEEITVWLKNRKVESHRKERY
ncbi:MAG: glycosyltransferase family A protein [Cyanobacteria bacterium J06621_8]